MPATLGSRRRCPYCGETIRLGHCPIVATNYLGMELRSAESTVEDVELYSGQEPVGMTQRTGWPIIAPAPVENARAEAPAEQPRRGMLATVLRPEVADVEEAELAQPLPPLPSQGAGRADLPARACPSCAYPLPQSIDERRAMVVAVAGVNRVGKTHLLATSLTRAYRSGALRNLGCTEFVPDDLTSARFTEDYFQPLFRRRQLLDVTAPEEQEISFRPLIFNVTLGTLGAFSLVLHDVSGEVLADHRARAAQAGFLRAARGLIFVVDPRDIDGVRDRLPDWVLENNEMNGDQGALLAACLGPAGIGDAALVPLAMTIAKADLLTDVEARPPGFLQPADVDEDSATMFSRLRRNSREIEAYLERMGGQSVLAPARAYAKAIATAHEGGRRDAGVSVTYHAVSALGAQPDIDEQLTAPVQPLNVLDPLAAILAQLGEIRSA